MSALQRTLTLRNLKLACLGAVRTVSVIGLIVAGQIAAQGLSPIALIMLLLLFYAVLGCVLEGMSSIVMTLPITLPLVLAAGFDKI